MEPRRREIPVSRQCELIGLSRTAYYYSKPTPIVKTKKRVVFGVEEPALV